MAVPVLATSTTTGRFTSSSNWNGVSKPAGVAAGDLLIIIVDTNNASGNPNTPAGWTLGPAESSGSARIHTFWRIADGSEGATFAVTFTSAKTGAMACLRITGEHLSDPLGASGQASNVVSGGAANPTTVGSITTTAADCLLLAIADCGFSTLNNGFSVSPSTGWTKAVDLGTINQEQIEVFTKSMAAAGALGTQDWTSSSTGVNRAYLVFSVQPPAVTRIPQGPLSAMQAVQRAAVI